MTDPRIEAAARCLFGDKVDQSSGAREYLLGEVEKALAAADSAAKAHIVPHNIPADRMRVAKNTLRCWKGGALSDEDAIGMIVCAVANAPLKGSGNG